MVGHIFINGEIGSQTTPESFRAQINPKSSEYILHFNSEGGDVYDGYQMGNMILNLGKPTTAIVEGLCASIATYMACCADKVIMTPQSDWVIHDPTASTSGRAQDFISAASKLVQMKGEIISRYMTKLNGKKTTQQLSEAMDKETILNASEAKQWGFADDVQERLRAVAKIDIKKFNMENINEETKTFFKSMGEKIDKLLGLAEKKKPIAKVKPKAIIKPKPKKDVKNRNIRFVSIVTLTLTDGTTINVNADDPNNLVGAPVSAADGSNLDDGIYETTDGEEITIAGGVVAEVEEESVNNMDSDANNPDENMDPENESDDNPQEDQDPDVKKMQAQINELKQKLSAAAKLETSYKAQVEDIQKSFKEFKRKTVGDKNPPRRAPVYHNHEENEQELAFFQMMARDVVPALKGRGLIKEDED